MNEPRTINEWMSQLAFAIVSYDDELIQNLEGVTRGWLQTSEETEAQMDLIEAAWEAIER